MRVPRQDRGGAAGAPAGDAGDAVRRVTALPPADVADRPDEAWAAVFLGEGFDPVDGAYRVKALSRSPGARFGMVRDGSRTVAVGCGSHCHGWVSFHGMRTDLARRGAEAVILGCTDLPGAVTDANSPLPVLDTASIHVDAVLAAG